MRYVTKSPRRRKPPWRTFKVCEPTLGDTEIVEGRFGVAEALEHARQAIRSDALVMPARDRFVYESGKLIAIVRAADVLAGSDLVEVA